MTLEKNKLTEKINFLPSGKIAFDKIISRIREAEHSITICMFIWRDDNLGQLIAEELLIAAKKSVKIVIYKDKLGSIFELSELNKQSLFHSKINFKLLLTQKILNYCNHFNSKLQKSNHSLISRLRDEENITIHDFEIRNDHSKCYIFDNKIMILGGMNIGSEYVHPVLDGKKWDDYMIELNGEEFFTDWRKKKDSVENSFENSDIEFKINNIEKGLYEIKTEILLLLSNVKNSVFIQVPYLGDKDITDKIIEIVNSGKKVTIIIPKLSNFQNASNYKILNQITKKTNHSISIYLHPNMLHAKTLLIDDNILFFGSANLNHKALNYLSELNLTIRGNKKDTIRVIKEFKKSLFNNLKISRKIKQIKELKYNYIVAFFESLI